MNTPSAKKLAAQKLAAALPFDPQCKAALQNLLGFLRAMHWNYWTAHWQVKGDPFYGDHLMFQRLYEGMEGEIDGTAEKIVGIYGSEAVGGHDSIDRAHNVLKRWCDTADLYARALQTEEELQMLLVQVRSLLSSKGHLSLGLDSFLQGLADTHETNVYLLQQRTTP